MENDLWSVGVFGGMPASYPGGPGSSPGRTFFIGELILESDCWFGALVQWDDSCFASRQCEFDSHTLHCFTMDGSPRHFPFSILH